MPTCNCIGPQVNEPVCPCRMKNLKQVDGRWIEIIDHGPVKEESKIYRKEFYYTIRGKL